ncbi:MAG: Ribose-phosphate pyrophosphokinase [candidate division BRC1 bacterium ADurb.BinA364]|nr:MAG: Ribose-phosphate pyrophosphokinase [candidate division BRC1 bacterium ADurb.BinA364]
MSIRARVCADALEAAGADRAVFVDLHSPQEQGFFRIPVDDLYSMPVLCRRAMRQREGDMVVVAPDPGIIKKARGFASALQVATAIANQPTGPGEKTEIIGDVAGKTALIVDDFVISGETLFDTAAALRENGAQRVYAAVTHAAPTLEGMRRLQASAIERILTTDTVECHPQPLPERFEAVSLAPLLGEAIRRIHNKESLSVLFPPPDAQIAVFEESMAAWPGALESGHDRR